MLKLQNEKLEAHIMPWCKMLLSNEELDCVVLTSKLHCERLAAIAGGGHLKGHCGHQQALDYRDLGGLAWAEGDLGVHNLPVPAGYEEAELSGSAGHTAENGLSAAAA